MSHRTLGCRVFFSFSYHAPTDLFKKKKGPRHCKMMFFKGVVGKKPKKGKKMQADQSHELNCRAAWKDQHCMLFFRLRVDMLDHEPSVANPLRFCDFMSINYQQELSLVDLSG